MRRSMRQDILVTKPPKTKEHKARKPKKPKRKPRKPKNPQPKCKELRLYFSRLISLAGASNIDRNEWAGACFVHIKTLNKWLIGYPPSEDLIYRISRYIAPKAGLEVEEVFAKIKTILKDWRNP